MQNQGFWDEVIKQINTLVDEVVGTHSAEIEELITAMDIETIRPSKLDVKLLKAASGIGVSATITYAKAKARDSMSIFVSTQDGLPFEVINDNPALQ